MDARRKTGTKISQVVEIPMMSPLENWWRPSTAEADNAAQAEAGSASSLTGIAEAF
jgi:hypothetical protein